jgi:hypothetical protein
MARKRGTNKTSAPASKTRGGNKKQPTQKTPMKRIAIMGPTGKLRFEWVPW